MNIYFNIILRGYFLIIIHIFCKIIFDLDKQGMIAPALLNMLYSCKFVSLFLCLCFHPYAMLAPASSNRIISINNTIK